MEIGIIGLGQSGKSALFQAFGGVKTEGGKSGRIDASVAMVKVPDPRLDMLSRDFNPKKTTPAEVMIIDFIGAAEGTKGFSSRRVADLRKCDAIILCLRAFDDDSVAHPEGSIDPARDLETIYFEFAMADIEVIQRRLERIDYSLSKSSKKERGLLHKEREFLVQCGETLDNGGQISDEALPEEAKRMLRGFGFLSDKPLVVALNINESDIGKDLDPKLPVRSTQPPTPVIALCAKIESELAMLDEADRAPFLREYGIGEIGRDVTLRAAWDALGLICFFTVGDDEVRAWPIFRGDTASAAADKIHSDIARGFIRAEVAAYDDYRRFEGMAGVREKGRFRLEGKTYQVADGDIINFRFNV